MSLRLLAASSKVEARRIHQGKLSADDWPRLKQATERLAQSPLYVHASPELTIADVEDHCRRLRADLGTLDLIILDFVQLLLLEEDGSDRYAELSAITRRLKILAAELDATLVVVSQLNREVERRFEKRPILSDLRDSGVLEDAADVVLLLYRDEYYNLETELQGIAEVTVAKNRRGYTGTAKLAWLNRYAKFADLAPSG